MKVRFFQRYRVPCNGLRAEQEKLAEECVSESKVWPAQSLGGNITEQMLTELKRRIRQKNPCNLEDLCELRP